MTLADLYEKLSYGVLSNLSLANDGSGEIKEEQQPKISMYINEALLKLYSRFILKEKDVLIEQVEHYTFYHLLEKYAETQWPDSGVTIPYIKDLNKEPFTEDVIRILAVYNSFGIQLPLNDNHRMDSLFTPQAKLLQVPRPQHGVALSVHYQAKHDTISHNDLTAEIQIPDVLEPALVAYIGHLTYFHMNTPESSIKAQDFISIYEATCQEVILQDLVSTSISTTNSRFVLNGWV